MDFQKYLNGAQATSNKILANDSFDTQSLVERVTKLIEHDPDLALFGVSLVAELEENRITPNQALQYLQQAESRYE